MKKLGGWILWLLMIPSPLFSFFNISVSTLKVEVSLNSSQVYTGEISLTNHGSEDLYIKIYVQDFEYVNPSKGIKKFLPAGSVSHSCADWITFYPQRVILKAHSLCKIKYKIITPADFSSVHWAVMFFEAWPASFRDTSSGGLILIGRVGTLFFVQPRHKCIYKLDIKNVYIENGDIYIKLENTGNTFLVPETVFYIMDENNIVLKRGKVPPVYLTPQVSSYIKCDIPKNIPKGKYIMVININIKEDKFIVKEIEFTKTSQEIKILHVR